MELTKEKREHILYCLVCVKEIFLTFVSYVNIYCIEYTFRIYILLHFKKHSFIPHTLLLLVFIKIIKSLQCILNAVIYNTSLIFLSILLLKLPLRILKSSFHTWVCWLSWVWFSKCELLSLLLWLIIHSLILLSVSPICFYLS